MGGRCAGCPDPSCEYCGGALAEEEEPFTKCDKCGSLIVRSANPDLAITLLLSDGSSRLVNVEGVNFTVFVQDWMSFRKQKNADAQMVILTHPSGSPEIAIYMRDVKELKAVPFTGTESVTAWTLRYP